MFRISARLLVATVVGLGSVSCSSVTGPSDDVLAEGEAPALAQVLLFAALNSTSVLPPPPPDRVGSGWDMRFEASVRCPGGGQVDLAASLSVEGDAERADYRLRQIPDECGGGSGRPFRVSAAVPIEAEVAVLRDRPGRTTWTGSTSGEVTWRTHGRAGRCTFRLDFDGAEDAGTGSTLRFRGDVCGYGVDHSVPLALD